MRSGLPPMLGLLMGVLLLAHSVVAFQKWRWVTGLLEVVAALVFLAQWWMTRSLTTASGTTARTPGDR